MNSKISVVGAIGASLCALAVVIASCAGSPDGTGAHAHGTAGGAITLGPEGAGDSGTPAGAAGAPVFRLAARSDGSHAFDHNRHTASGDRIVLLFRNDSGIPHDMVIERDGRVAGRTRVITKGETQALVTGLTPGRYAFYCSVGGHRSDGMEGVLEMTG
ncbi:cupredoxin domain-containing protein [Actinomadura terrae]|uniref:cupredoxin domain-containing protein n=1 Tax=Actinomadura terrae TaxID=604353 RepID=UPI001FA6EE50|nr:cupredoxin domain-containing protein [Actinomadura terrae]